MSQILDGKTLSRQIRNQLKDEVAVLLAQGVTPRLEVIVAAQDPASLAYVRMKRKWAADAGIETGVWEVNEQTRQEQLMEKVHELNERDDVHGVLIQHPLPGHLDESAALLALSSAKDVDGISPGSMGRLVAGMPGFRCATPLGITTLLKHYGINVEGKRALVIGRSVILGKPMALMLLEMNATVTIAHSKSTDLPSLCKDADVLVAAVGRAEMVKGEWIKPGAIVIDAGYNRVEGRATDVGDCDFEGCARVSSWITPVPGGVGPMTVASLLQNTVVAARLSLDS